ncbi:MAG: DNA cytosine methyltransferase, partial [Salinibacterium sp.]
MQYGCFGSHSFASAGAKPTLACVPVETARDLDADFLRAATRPKVDKKRPRKLGVVDLFSGCGGLTIGAIEGARRKGVEAELRLAVDQWGAALDVLQCSLDIEDERVLEMSVASIFGVAGQSRDTKARQRLKDIAPTTDLLLAGPPCQGHSALNNHTRHDDDRNELYVAMADAAELLEPKVVIIENVR